MFIDIPGLASNEKVKDAKHHASSCTATTIQYDRGKADANCSIHGYSYYGARQEYIPTLLYIS